CWESYSSLLRSTLKLTSGSRTFGDSSVYFSGNHGKSDGALGTT
ncbi:unnamed protein product, partial [Porites lobata]